MILDRYKGKDREEAEKMLRQAALNIEIELPPKTAGADEAVSALRAVFAVPGESLVDVVPSYWRKYFEELEGRPDNTPKHTAGQWGIGAASNFRSRT